MHMIQARHLCNVLIIIWHMKKKVKRRSRKKNQAIARERILNLQPALEKEIFALTTNAMRKGFLHLQSILVEEDFFVQIHIGNQ